MLILEKAFSDCSDVDFKLLDKLIKFLVVQPKNHSYHKRTPFDQLERKPVRKCILPSIRMQRLRLNRNLDLWKPERPLIMEGIRDTHSYIRWRWRLRIPTICVLNSSIIPPYSKYFSNCLR